MIKNKKIVSIIQKLLENRRFFVEMDGRKSRWPLQKNGLPQGSVLVPTLFNIYTNDQPEFDRTRRFIYADDLCLATQSTSFNAIETRLTDALSSLTNYYTENSLNANPSKTQVKDTVRNITLSQCMQTLSTSYQMPLSGVVVPHDYREINRFWLVSFSRLVWPRFSFSVKEHL
ncbi:RNA-directed DNA polymerase from mobile element jockey [Elysia marginata]|uniref:RNA-directed DNA polymerase from mobile element jockey n=1 Tax=Elysia marginata TaxID=1093978 RepID=A0AAV4FN27_9GAST|nr:RNA-directed DNA polymerase from mobile element jockey [Elysia marginata]